MRVLAEDLCMPHHGCSFHWVQSLHSVVQRHDDMCCNDGLFIRFDRGNDLTDLRMGPVQLQAHVDRSEQLKRIISTERGHAIQLAVTASDNP